MCVFVWRRQKTFKLQNTITGDYVWVPHTVMHSSARWQSNVCQYTFLIRFSSACYANGFEQVSTLIAPCHKFESRHIFCFCSVQQMYSTKDLVEKVSYQCGTQSNAAGGCIHMKIKSWHNFRLPHLAVSACSMFLVMENKLAFCTGYACVQTESYSNAGAGWYLNLHFRACWQGCC